MYHNNKVVIVLFVKNSYNNAASALYVSYYCISYILIIIFCL